MKLDYRRLGQFEEDFGFDEVGMPTNFRVEITLKKARMISNFVSFKFLNSNWVPEKENTHIAKH